MRSLGHFLLVKCPVLLGEIDKYLEEIKRKISLHLGNAEEEVYKDLTKWR